jgi:hypothetical protein
VNAKETRRLQDGTTVELHEVWCEAGQPPSPNRIYDFEQSDGPTKSVPEKKPDDPPKDDRLTLAQRKLQRENLSLAEARAELRRIGEPVIDDAIARRVVDVGQRENLISMFEAEPQQTRAHLEALEQEQSDAAYARELAPRLGVKPEEVI